VNVAQNNKNPNHSNARFRLYTAAEIIQRPEPPYLIRGILHTGSAAMVFGYYGEGKTTLAQDLAFSIGAGLSWHGHDVRQGTVVYIAAEDDAFLGRQIRAWCQEHGLTDSGCLNVYFLPAAPQLAAGDVHEVLQQIHALPLAPVLIAIDTLSATFVGSDENTQKDTSRFNDAVNTMRRETGATVLTIHHTGKNRESERGSTALGANCDLILKVEMSTKEALRIKGATTPAQQPRQFVSLSPDDMREGSTPPKTTSTITITCTKNRRGPRHPRMTLALKPVVIDGMVDEYGDPITACVLIQPDSKDVKAGILSDALNHKERALLEVLDRLMVTHHTDTIRSGVWEGGSNVKGTSFQRARRELDALQYVTNTSKGYQFTDKGRAMLPARETAA
jgi:hypothetical protein